MYHPITVELLSKSQEYDRAKRQEVCQLRNGLSASESTSLSQIQRGTDLLVAVLIYAGKRLREAKIAVQALGSGRASGQRVTGPRD